VTSEEGKQDEKRGFVVIDRRRAAAEEAPSGEAVAEKEPAPEPGREARRPARRALPPVDFSTFVLSLGTSAMHHLGLLPDPETGRHAEPDLDLARQTIDTLELLQAKTRGNLTAEEEQLLQHLLTDLRMRWVEASRD
jgi:hypothetical protein